MKKYTKLLSSILLIALVACLCLTLAVGAFAEDTTKVKFVGTDSAAFINHSSAVNIDAGEGITLEFQITEFTADSNLAMTAQMGFAISDAPSASDSYHYGTKGSFIFGQKRSLGIFLGKHYNEVVDSSWYETVKDQKLFGDNFDMTGVFNWPVVLAPGNWVKVEYMSASSETAEDGYWKIYNKLDENEEYELVNSVVGLNYQDAPYGGVYFGPNFQFPMVMNTKNFSCKTTGGEDVILEGGARGTVTYGDDGEGGGSGGIIDVSTIPDVSTVTEITFTGIAGKNEAVNRYTQIFAPAGQAVTLTFDVMSVDNSFMSYPQFGFSVSNAEAVGQMHAAGTAGSYVYGEKGDKTVRLYSKEKSNVATGDAPLGFTMTGAFPHDEEVVAGRSIKVEYYPASSGNDGYWKIYSKATGTEEEYELLASAIGLSATDAPSGTVFFGIHTYRTYVLTARDITVTAAGAKYTLDRGDLCDLSYTNKIGDETIITRTDMSFGEVGKDIGQSAIANVTPVVLPAGGTITMEGVILDADLSMLSYWGNVGFSVGNAYSTGALYSAGTRGSYFFGQSTRALGIYVDKTYGLYSSFVTDRPPAETGLSISGTLRPQDWLISGYTIKVEYKAASSSTAKDGTWKFYTKKPGDAGYTVKYQVTGMNIDSAPYGAVYFGMDCADILKVSFGELMVYTQDNEEVVLSKAKGRNNLNTYLALNGVVEEPLRSFERKVFNSGFEITDDENVVVGWTGTGTIESDSDNLFEGEKSAKITGAASLVSEKADITKGLHQISVATNSATPFDIKVTYFSDTTELSSETITISGNGAWSDHIHNITVPSSADNMKLTLITPEGFEGNVDGIHVYKAVAEYATWRVENSKSADETLMWLNTGYANYGTIVETNKEDYFKAVKEYDGALTTDTLAELVFDVNLKDFPVSTYVENSDFEKVDVAGYPVDWVINEFNYDSQIQTTDGAVVINNAAIRSRYIDARALGDGLLSAAFNIRALNSDSEANLYYGIEYYDANFEYVTNFITTTILTSNEYQIFEISDEGELDESIKYFRIIVGGGDSAIVVNGCSIFTDIVSLNTYLEYVEEVNFETIKGENTRVSEIKSDLDLSDVYYFTWTSSNTDYVSNDGKVTRPSYGQSAKHVVLTASATINGETVEKEINLLVLPEDYDKYEAMTFFNSDVNYTYSDYFGWGGYISENNKATYGFSDAFAFEGKSIKIANAAGLADLRSYTVFDVRNNSYYRAEAMVYTDSESTAPIVMLEFLDYQNLTIATYSVNYNLSKRGTWQNLVAEGYAPNGAVSVAIRIRIPSASPDTAYFDELRIYRQEGLDNADFAFGTREWTVSGTANVSENVVTLNGKMTSDYKVIGEGSRYLVSTTANKDVDAGIIFYNSSKAQLASYTVEGVSGDISFAEYAPVGAKYAKVWVESSEDTDITAVNIDNAPVGTTIYDSNFEKLTASRTTGWTVDGTVTGSTNALTVSDGATLSSYKVTIQEGKKYAIVANLASDSEYAVATAELYNYSNALAETYTLTKSGTVLSHVFDCPLDGYYVVVKLSSVGGATIYKDANIYAIASSVSSASFEQVDAVVTGNMPLQWSSYGEVGVYAASKQTAKEVELEVPDIMHVLEVVSYSEAGGVQSAMIEGLVGGREYTASAYMKTSGSAKIIVKYYDSNFALIDTFEKTIQNVTAWERVKLNTTAPVNATYATVSLEQSNEGVLYADVVELSPTIVVVGDTVQHFIDDYIVEESENVDREFHDATMTEPVLDWTDDTDGTHEEGAYIYGTVLYDEDEEIYKMWYNPVGKNSSVKNGYATSTDGVNWTRPNLNLYNFNGSTNNNLYSTSEFPSIFIDYETTDPAKRYVSITFNELTYSHMVKYSADGLRWVDGPVFMNSGDVLTAAHDEVNDLYFALAKRGRKRRDFYTMVTGDLTNFSTGVIANTLANPLDSVGFWNTQCYGAGLYALGGSYVALDWLLAIPGTGSMCGPDYIGFAFTRDLEEDWLRPYGSNYIVPMTDESGYEWKSLYSASYPIVMGDELWLYIGAWEGYHEVSGDKCGITIAKWRKDGFASMNTGVTEGTILTKPMIFNGSALSVNAKVKEGGYLKVELVDRDGNVYEGFSASDCDAVVSDGTSMKVTWNGSNDLSSLRGKVVRARFISTNTELYSFKFVNDGATTVTGTKVELKDGYNYDVEMEENAQIKASAESTLMDGDSVSVEMKVIETITADSTVEVGVLGYDNAKITLDNADDVFTAGYTVKVEYTNVEGDAAYIKVYRKETGAESYGEAIVSETGLKSAIFARLALWSTSGLEGTISEVKFYVNSTQISGMLVDDGVKFTELAKPLEEVGPKKLTATGYSIYGYNEGIDVGYGGTLTMSFDCLAYDNSMKAHIRLAVTDDDPRANPGAAGNYKNGYAGAIMGFATVSGAMDWYGNGTTTKNTENFMLAGYSYKLVYTATSASSKADGSLILYECKTSKVGTVDQNWEAVFSCTGLGNTAGGNSFSPINNVKINIYSSGEGFNMVVANLIVSSSASVQKFNQMYASAAMTVEDSDLVPDAPDSELLPEEPEGGEGGGDEEEVIVDPVFVTLDYNGATGFESDVIKIERNTAFAEPDMTNVSLAGATFVKWVDAEGNDYDFNSQVSQDITLSAIFESNYGMDMPIAYTSTAAQYFGINENVNVGYGKTLTWQFDVLSYENAGYQIRMVASTATAESGSAMAYKIATGESSQVMGFTSTGGEDWYGGNVTKTKTLSNLFLAGYTYRLSYTAPSSEYATDASFTLYECDSTLVGSASESWTAVYSTSPFGNTEGGNHFAPITSVNLNIYFGSKGIKFGAINHKLFLEDTEQVHDLYLSDGMDWDYAPYVKYGTGKKITMTGDSVWGHFEDGINIGYGGEVTMQFDVLSATIGARWAFGVTNVGAGAVAKSPATIRTYKDPYQGQVLGYAVTSSGQAASIMDWYGGSDYGTTRNATTAFVAGYTYKFVYKAATGETAGDGYTVLMECPTSFVGTALENWTEILWAKNFDNSGATNGFSPVTDVLVGVWTNGNVELEVDNAKVTAKTADKTSLLDVVPSHVYGAAVIDKTDYVAPKTELKVNMSSTGVFGFNENGLNLDYGESVTWMFDIVGEVAATGWWGYIVTEGDVKANISNATNYKDSWATNRFFWNGSSYDYLTGTMASSYKYYNAMESGYTYKLVYTAPSAEGVNDGSFILTSCATNLIGTEEEAWATVGSLTAFGNNYASGYKFAPMTNVKLNIWTNGTSLSFTIKNSKIIFNDGSVMNDVPYYASTNVTVE